MGEVYLPHHLYRVLLTRAFGPGGWKMIPQEPPWRQDNELLVHYALYCQGVFVSEATAGAMYYPKNPRMTWSDALESATSRCVRRLCKDLGAALECWDRRWTRDWMAKYAITVPVKSQRGITRQWRRADGPPLPGEQRHKHQSMETEYDRPPTVDDEARAHMEDIQNDY